MRKLSQEEFLEKCRISHGYKFDYSLTKYKNNRTKIIVICPEHGKSYQIPLLHIKNHGCPECAKIIKAKKRKKPKSQILSEFKLVHKNKYNYDKFECITVSAKGIITCRIHGDFLQTAHSHKNGSGCPKCGRNSCNKRKSKDQVIKDFQKIHNHQYDYSNMIYITSSSDVEIICKKHGPFWLKCSKHKSGRGCPKCSKEKLIKKLSLNVILKRFKDTLGDRYDYSKFEYKNANEPGIVICKEHGEFLVTARSHLKSECRKCSGYSPKTKEHILALFEKAHGKKYNYNNVNFTSISQKVEIICPSHGAFLKHIRSHINGVGCPTCKEDKRRQKLYNRFIKESNLIHNNKYNYDKVSLLSVADRIIIGCPEHGEIIKIASNHMGGHGCQKCYNKKQAKSKDQFIIDAKHIHKNRYNYSKVIYVNDETKIIIICKKHGEFLTTPRTHLKGSNCPTCHGIISRSEMRWLDYLNIKERQKNIKIDDNLFKVDGFDKKTNTIYEFYGDFWHGNPMIYSPNEMNTAVNKTFGELYQKTLNKEHILKNAGYNLITIWECDWKEKIVML